MRRDYLQWSYVEQVFNLGRRFINLSTGVVMMAETHHGLTSLTPVEANSNRLLALQRTCWGIENGLHYRLDVTLRKTGVV